MIRKNTSKAFTLIELLTVIAIIGILGTLIIGAVGKAKDRAVEVKAKAGARSLATAWTLYKQDYRRFPVDEMGMMPDSSQSVHVEKGNGMKMDVFTTALLRGDVDNEAAEKYNTNETIYLDVREQLLGDGLGEFSPENSPRTIYVDPWNQPYKFKLDVDRNTRIRRFDESLSKDFEINPEIQQDVIVWSVGPDGKDQTLEDAEDDLNSWN